MVGSPEAWRERKHIDLLQKQREEMMRKLREGESA